MTWSAAGVQSGTDANLTGLSGTTGITSLSLGDATIYKPLQMLNVTGTLSFNGLLEKLVFDNQQDTAVGGTSGATRDHDIQVSGTLNINLSSVSNGVTIYAPDWVYWSRRPAPSGGGGEHQLNATGSSFYITPTGTANLTGGTYVTQFNFACDTGGRLNVTGSHLKGRGSRFWMKTGSITTFQNCTIENFAIFFNAFPTTITGVTFRQCGTITKETSFNAGFDAAPNVVLAPQWLATANPIINIWGGAWLRVKNSSGGSSLGVLNIATHPFASGIADFVQDVQFRVKDLSGAAVTGFKFSAIESNDGNRRNVRQYTGVGPFFNNTDIRTLSWTSAAGGLTNTIEARLQAGVTTLTPTATPGSGGLVTTNYGQTTADEYDVYGIGYGYSLYQKRIQFRANGALIVDETVLPELSITQANPATVAAYTSPGDTAQQFFDYAFLVLFNNYARQTAPYVTRVGNTINAGSQNVTFDATASTPFSIAGSTITIKSVVSTCSLTTAGTITLANGAVFQNNTVSAAALTLPPSSLAALTDADITGPITATSATPLTLTFTDSAIRTSIANPGAGLLTIRLQNSTVAATSGSIVLQQVTSLTLTDLEAGTSLLVADGSGAEVEYVASSGTSYTRDTTGGSGTWSVKAAKLGKLAKTITHSPATASTTASMALAADATVTETVAATIAAYTALGNPDKVQDYAAYLETTQAYIARPRMSSKAGGSVSFDAAVNMRATGALWAVDGSGAITFKSGATWTAGVTMSTGLLASGAVSVGAGVTTQAAISAPTIEVAGTIAGQAAGEVNISATGVLAAGAQVTGDVNRGETASISSLQINGALSFTPTAPSTYAQTNCTIGIIRNNNPEAGTITVRQIGGSILGSGEGINIVYPVTISRTGGGVFNLIAQVVTDGEVTQDLGYQANATSFGVDVPLGSSLQLCMWSLGYVSFVRSYSISESRAIEIDLIAEPDVDITLNVATYLANISVTYSGATFTATFLANMLIDGIEPVKAIVHRLLGQESPMRALLPPGTDTMISIEADEIQMNKPAIFLRLGAAATDVQVLGYFNTEPAKTVDPAYVINPRRADNLRVEMQPKKPDIDADQLAIAVAAKLSATTSQVERIAKLHGLGATLTVTPTTRTAGSVNQTISTVGDTTTVTEA